MEPPAETASKTTAAPAAAAAQEPELKNLGQIIRHYRELRGLTQLQVANAMGHRTPEWCGMLESGNRALDIDRAPELAGVLKINQQDFTTHAVMQYYPKAAAALFPTPKSALKMRSQHKAELPPLAPAIYEFARVVEGLPPDIQDALVRQALAVQDLIRNGNHDRARSRTPLPINRGQF
jgi:transcriptional regulator with XRE-family HTH domain